MLHEELYSESSDQKLLTKMGASVNDACDTVRRTVELIEQSRIMLRQFDGYGALIDHR